MVGAMRSQRRRCSSSSSVPFRPVLVRVAFWSLVPALLVHRHLRHWWSFHSCLVLRDEGGGGGGGGGGAGAFCAVRPRNHPSGRGGASPALPVNGVPPPGLVELHQALVEGSFVVADHPKLLPDGVGFDGTSWHVPPRSGGAVLVAFQPPPRKPRRRHNHQRNTPLPLATGFLWILNAAIFLWLWNDRVDPSRVATPGDAPGVARDPGKGLSGHLSHFEIWHVGCNLASLSSLGEMLESAIPRVGGTIPLLLSTLSFLPVATGIVAGLYAIRNYLWEKGWWWWGGARQTQNNPPPTPPSMVGFSGILFAWMVVAALEGGRSCPVFFLPDLCFDTFSIWPGSQLRLSLGPLVQLVFLQAVLPRVSFAGHLSGIILGFVWAWGWLPPLLYWQPALLYPIAWWACQKQAAGSGRASVPASASWPHANSDSRRRKAELVCWQAIGAAIAVVHLVFLAWFHPASTLFLTGLAQLAFVVLLAHRTHHAALAGGDAVPRLEEARRACVFLGILWCASDAALLGGWFAAWGAWSGAPTAMPLLLCRIGLAWTGAFVAASGTSPAGGTTFDLFCGSHLRACKPVGDALVGAVQEILAGRQEPQRPLPSGHEKIHDRDPEGGGEETEMAPLLHRGGMPAVTAPASEISEVL